MSLVHTLCVHTDHISDALVTNKTGSSVTLKDGFLLGTFEVLDLSCNEEALPLPVAGVNAQGADVMDLTDVMAHLRPHISVLDYPEAKPALLHLLAQNRQAVAIPGEPLRAMNKVTHYTAVQPGAQPSYVPFYWLLHNQMQVVQQKVDELLQGVIEESHSSWNSPLVLVPKKDSSYLPVIDFQKVNAFDIPRSVSTSSLE